MDYVSIYNIRFYQTSRCHDKININQPTLVRVSGYIYMINVSCDFFSSYVYSQKYIDYNSFVEFGFYYANKLSEK